MRVPTFSVCAVLTLFVVSVSANTYTGTLPFSGATVGLEFTGGITGSDTIDVISGNVEVELTEVGGVFTTLEIIGGAFVIDNASIDLTISLPIGGPLNDTLTTTDFGCALLGNTLGLTSLGSGQYAITGTVDIQAEQGQAEIVGPPSQAWDFWATPESIEATLLGTSVLTITDSDPNDGMVSASGELRFNGEELDRYTPPGGFTAAFEMSSVNTLDFGGPLIIPEPGSLTLLLVGAVGILRWRRFS